ncbi:hypothetical protein [Glaciecola sp. KUL10]|uniref:hypothetical protein n=1 Tax=Glaciecola sp. (strain KUL10) TaxID=2161813 RepID=UPI000D922A38|nr:hypothetical protein [Glaciecola sp. KUL10]GBL02835.1 hypothetical protein KUL10_01080 [Glaciecola sp. KUL10]
MNFVRSMCSAIEAQTRRCSGLLQEDVTKNGEHIERTLWALTAAKSYSKEQQALTI